ncbi:MAG: 5'-nucleotidase C-terminal domain-containing protein [Erysipelotrichaceae bacterium]|nr:5'-nucleotidase C-terminal domain-containing protein [Erysipelotrichaceae bacterium]
MIRKLTLLHSNDPHGAFLPVIRDGIETGDISLLSGCLNEIRKKEKNCLYAIAGDLFKGSLIDAEFKGISTIEMINLLRPDIVTIGNHEADYGLAHLLFLEKCARFPIINANMFITGSQKRLFQPYRIIQIGGMKVLFIGLVTDEILLSAKSEELISSYLNVDSCIRQIATVVDSYKTTDIDLTVLLTHIGYEEDKRLAEDLDAQSGIDLIIGAHSHTLLKKPKLINGIPIVQTGSGFEHLGRFDIEIDTDQHRMLSYDWQVLDIDASRTPKDALMEEVLKAYSQKIEDRSSRILTTFARKLSHPSRHEETELSNLFADLMQEDSSFDIMMLGCGSFRGKELGPVVDYRSFREIYPFENEICMLQIKGSTFRKICRHFLRGSVLSKGSSEYYAFSKGVFVTYDYENDSLTRCEYKNREIDDKEILKIALQRFHLDNCEEFLGVSGKELTSLHEAVTVVKSDISTYEEILLNSFGLDSHIEGRTIVIKN